MSIESVAVGYIQGQLEDIANRIRYDMVDIVSRHSRSGKAVSAIQIERTSPISYFIGAHVGSDRNDGGLHLLYLDEGNGGRGRVIRPKGRALGQYPGGIPGIGWRSSVHGYEGIHFVAEVASKYK